MPPSRKCFALKGGRAINFFFQDCPRLSVDIDLCYFPLSGRDEAFRDIRENMEAMLSDSGHKERTE